MRVTINLGDLEIDDVRDIAIRITDKLVNLGYIPDCTDTDNGQEFEVQDIIFSELLKKPK